jgi:hypothetical protein
MSHPPYRTGERMYAYLVLAIVTVLLGIYLMLALTVLRIAQEAYNRKRMVLRIQQYGNRN